VRERERPVAIAKSEEEKGSSSQRTVCVGRGEMRAGERKGMKRARTGRNGGGERDKNRTGHILAVMLKIKKERVWTVDSYEWWIFSTLQSEDVVSLIAGA
jgi:hypothetical protein